MSLSDGRLEAAARTQHSGTFIDLDKTSRTGEVVDAWIMTVSLPGLPTQQGAAVQWVEHQRVDCKAHTHLQLGLKAFDRKGAMVMWMFEPAPEPNDSGTFAVLDHVLCDEVTLPASNTVVGHQAAFDMTEAAVKAGR